MATEPGSDDDLESSEMSISSSASRNNIDTYGDESDDGRRASVSLGEPSSDPYPRPRDHAYLVSSHPLIADGQLPGRSMSVGGRKSFDLAVLELFGVVLFPGSTIPVKLRDRSLIEYLGRQIAICRELPQFQSEVRLGILAHRIDPIKRRRGVSNAEESLIGRVGTIATVKYTHERTDITSDSLNSSNVWRRYQEGNELVFTAVGTHRFRIISASQQHSTADSKIFEVEQIKDAPLPLPPIKSFFASPPNYIENHQRGSDETVQCRHSYRAWCLSVLTPVPYFVYKNKSPWKLVSDMVARLGSSKGRNHLPSLGDINPEIIADPTKFSFWCASNMPFSESDRVALLETNSTFERLRAISYKVEDLASRESHICCSRCETRLSSVESVFTVGGAEGATSAYVNDHGYIHQITTLREVDAEKILLFGPPSTENSYFPGYSWTICYCMSCAGLLGWSFRLVGRVGESADRPTLFFGFMSSNVLISDLPSPDDGD